MKEEKLKGLLEKYYNGNTSIDEEFLLKDYFSGNDILPGYEAEREIFKYYTVNERITAPSDGLESKIIQSIDTLEKRQKHALYSRRRLIILSMAASLLILVGSYFLFIHKTEPEDTFDDPQIAYIEAKRVLYDISVRLNRGTQALQQITRIDNATMTGLKSIEKSTNLISGQIDRIEHLGRLIDTDDQKK